MRVAVVGTGYVGLVVGTCLAESGNDVICVDTDKEKLALLRQGVSPIYEQGLDELIQRNLSEKRLRFLSDLAGAVQDSRIIFIAVGVPPRADGSADLTAVETIAAEIGHAINGPKIVVTKSTVPVGTTRHVKGIIAGQTQHHIDIVSNPEFLKEGEALEDFTRSDRVVLGVENDEAAEVMKQLYAPFVRTGKPILVMDIESAELTKYAANALLATKISFINEIANLCERIGADVESVRKGIGSDSRIGYQFIFPGVGFGGSCLPKDLEALVNTGRAHGYDFQIVKAALDVNAARRKMFFDKIRDHFEGKLQDRQIAVWGLAFKPGTDDIRESPAICVVQMLLDQGAKVSAYDPKAMEAAQRLLEGGIVFAADQYDALSGADALVLVTEWQEFQSPDFERVATLMAAPVVFDGRNVYDPTRLRELGFTYYGIGRP